MAAGEATEAGEAGRTASSLWRSTSTHEALLAELVVDGAFLLVAEDLKSFRNLWKWIRQCLVLSPQKGTS